MNLIINLLLFVIICISARNIHILKPYQKAYLVFSVIIWLLITLYFCAKLVCLIYTKITKKKLNVNNVDGVYRIFKLCWIIIFGLAFLFMFIGFIYDIAIIIEGKIGSIVYPVIYFIVCFTYSILSFFDFIFNEKYIYLILRKRRVVEKSSDNLELNNDESKQVKKNEPNAEKEKKEQNKSKEE